MANSPAGPGWYVEAQRPAVEADPQTGRAVKGRAIGYVTPLGNHGEVFVPQSVYDLGPAAVKPLIAAAVANVDAIHQLKG